METVNGDSIMISFSSTEGDSSITINRYPKHQPKEKIMEQFDASMTSVIDDIDNYQKKSVRIKNTLYEGRTLLITENNGEDPIKLLILFYFKSGYYYHIVYEGKDDGCLLGTMLYDVKL